MVIKQRDNMEERCENAGTEFDHERFFGDRV